MTDLVLCDISKSYPAAPHKWVVSHLDLQVKNGEFFCLVGPSGCGKSTVLKLIVGAENPLSGEITRPEKVGMVFQSGALLPWLTVSENVAFGLKMANASDYKIKIAVAEYLKMMNLSEYRDKYPRQLSGGQKQRVGIARALAIKPELLLLDEPFSSLDPKTADELHYDLIKIWQETKITILMVSHLLEEAVYLADTVGIMMDGKLRDIMKIDLPRPRRREETEFLEKVEKLRKLFW